MVVKKTKLIYNGNELGEKNMRKVYEEIKKFISDEFGVFLLSIVSAMCILAFIEVIVESLDVITLENIEIYNEIKTIYITPRNTEEAYAGIFIDVTDSSGESWEFYDYSGSYIITLLGTILFIFFTIWNIISRSISNVFNLIYHKRNEQIYSEFNVPEYDVVLRTRMLDECTNIKEVQNKLINIKKEKDKGNLNKIEKNLIFSEINEEDELYKLVMKYKRTLNETKENKQFNDIHILINQRMREHGLLKRYTINDFIMMLGNNVKIDKNEFFNWLRKVVIEIFCILFILKLSQLIHPELCIIISAIVFWYVIIRIISIPYTKKYYEEKKKINIYNKMYNEKWGE